jgi:hypothetical protein
MAIGLLLLRVVVGVAGIVLAVTAAVATMRLRRPKVVQPGAPADDAHTDQMA